MALVLSTETVFGVTCAEAYWKITDCEVIEQIEGETKKYIAQARLAVWKDKDAKDAGKPAIHGGNLGMEMDMDSSSQHNLIKQLYLYAKTLDEFSSATDA